MDGIRYGTNDDCDDWARCRDLTWVIEWVKAVMVWSRKEYVSMEVWRHGVKKQSIQAYQAYKHTKHTVHHKARNIFVRYGT